MDIIIQLEPIINKNENILITLSNSDEEKSFMIELQMDELNHNLLNFVIMALLIVFYIYLIYKIREQRLWFYINWIYKN